ncbi:YojF family protein [Deinococcus pimensis]|uniref:YojF family protein n=1 Tax=Deinococcus pimensis TaxID=309888 RepID=UPI000488A5E4|nr:YojF family protein [Deinococcus pimensis]
MRAIEREAVQRELDVRRGRPMYLHLETNAGAYARLRDGKATPVGAYVRNGLVSYERGLITGSGPYRVGLKLELGWVYAEGLTDWEVDGLGRLLLAGHDADGGLGVALELSERPFPS